MWRPGPRWGDQTEVLFFLLGRGEKAATRHVLKACDLRTDAYRNGWGTCGARGGKDLRCWRGDGPAVLEAGRGGKAAAN